MAYLMESASLPVVILCGGRGTRLHEHDRSLPKPLVEVGGHPILWHVMQIYLAQGVRRLVLCLGHRGDLIERYVSETLWPTGVSVECLDTGEDTPTGGRILRARERVGEETFLATYADGVADVDLETLRGHHQRHGVLATVTVVRPQLPFGVAELDGDGLVRGFEEKPRCQHWVNGGFFCFEPGVFDYLTDDAALERAPLARLAVEGQLSAYRHTGYWDCMDTYKDTLALNDLWARDAAPWKFWE